MKQLKLGDFSDDGTKQILAFNSNHWQIIQFVPTSQNGQVFAWVLVNKKMYKVLINVPLRDPELQEIYGPKLSLDINFILNVEIGCVCKVKHSAKKHKRDTKGAWNLTDLQTDSTMKGSYLESCSYFCLYRSTFEERGAHLVCCPSLATIHAVLVTADKSTMLTPDILRRTFSEACQMFSFNPLSRPFTTKFLVTHVANSNKAGEVLEKIISEVRSELCDPVIAVITSKGVDSPKLGIPALDDFPCVNLSHKLPTVEADIIFQNDEWQINAANFGINGCVLSSSMFNKNVLLSRFAEVPAGNIVPDWCIQISDVFFARALRVKNQKLWVSNDGTPDTGSDNEEQVSLPALITKAGYHEYISEFKIKNLVNNVLQSEHANNLAAESHPSSLALCTLQELTKKWIKCAADSAENACYANELLENLSTWICSPASKFNDPALLQMFHKAMSPVFNEMLETLTKYPSQIIFANYSKVLCQYIHDDPYSLLTPITSEFFELQHTQTWDSLLFLDECNYSSLPFDVTHHDPDIIPLVVDSVSRWKIAENLPYEMQDHFSKIVSEFLCFRMGFLHARLTNGKEYKSEHLKDQIRYHFTYRLLKIVFDFVRHGSEKVKSDAHEFIEHICAVLELDEFVQDVQIMKKNLLTLLPDRHPEALSLSNQLCSHCNCSSDIDLCALQSQACSCRHCGRLYDRQKMENELLQIAWQRDLEYHRQDLVCLNCKQTKVLCLAEHCECGGSFGLKETATVFMCRMELLLKIAEHQKFELLEESISWILYCSV